LQYEIKSLSFTVAPDTRLTAATTASFHWGWGIPKIAAVRMDGWPSRQLSTLTDETFSPPDLTMSF
jgi:hypothetical protein